MAFLVRCEEHDYSAIVIADVNNQTYELPHPDHRFVCGKVSAVSSTGQRIQFLDNTFVAVPSIVCLSIISVSILLLVRKKMQAEQANRQGSVMLQISKLASDSIIFSPRFSGREDAAKIPSARLSNRRKLSVPKLTRSHTPTSRYLQRQLRQSRAQIEKTGESVNKVIKLLQIFCLCYIPKILTTLVLISRQYFCLTWHITNLIKFTLLHDLTQGIFIAYCVINPLLIANKDFLSV